MSTIGTSAVIDLLLCLPSWTDDYDVSNIATNAWHDRLNGMAKEAPELVFGVGAGLLDHEEPLVRSAAALALGRAAEAAAGLDMANRAEPLLLDRLPLEDDDDVLDSLASALGHVWTRQGDRSHPVVISLAADPHPHRRRAAAKSLGLTAMDPVPQEVDATLRRLLDDPDACVRWWARFGLDTARPI